MSQLYDKLKKKGWSDAEIDKAMKILGESRSAPSVRRSTPFLYWAGLFLAVIGNMIMAVTLVPFLVIMQGFSLYFVVALLALVFGSLISVLLHDIEDVDPEHKIMGWLFVPALALINVYIMVRVAGEFRSALFAGITDPATLNPVLISVTYVICFLIPYGIKQWLDRRR